MSETPPIFNLSFIKKVAIASGHFVNDITACIWFSYFLLYSQMVNGLSPDMAASLMLFGQLVDAVSTPAVGFLADKYLRFYIPGVGRYKSWHMLGVVLAVVTFPFIFSPPMFSINSSHLLALYYVPFIAVYEFSWAAIQISHLALIPKTTPDLLTRTEILSIRYVLMVVSNVIVFVLAWYTVGQGKSCVIGKDDVLVFQHLGMISMALGLTTAIIFYICTKEHDDDRVRESIEERDSETTPLLQRDKLSLSTKNLNPGGERVTFSDWIRLPQFYMVGAVYITGRLVINVPQAYLPLYLEKTLNLPCSTIATVPLTYFISGFLIATLMKSMTQLLGKQLVFGVGILLDLGGAALIICGTEFVKGWGVYAIFSLLGGGAAVGMVMGLAITADMIGNNVESGAFVYGFMSFCDKFSCGITIMLINLFTPGDAQLGIFYRDVLAFSCIGCALLATVGLIILTLMILAKGLISRNSEDNS